jgi:pyruvate kinase
LKAVFEIIATLGPASFTMARELALGGATALRLNASHLSPEELARRAAQAREGAPDLPIVVDLQGAKMRVGDIVERPLAAGARVRFAAEAAGPEGVSLPHPELFAAAESGATLGCDDGRLRFVVRARGEGWLEAEALVAGVLRHRKGVNLLDHPVRLSGLTPGDAARLEAVRGLPRLQVAWSFTLDGREAAWVRARVPGTPVVAKVERLEAVDALAEIAGRVDALWVCRGDLGEQLGPGALGRFVGSLSPADLRCPVLMAGQVLEHLTDHAEPTRSEVCHLYDLLARDYAGIVLSDETAIGIHPARAVRQAAALVCAFRDAARRPLSPPPG